MPESYSGEWKNGQRELQSKQDPETRVELEYRAAEAHKPPSPKIVTETSKQANGTQSLKCQNKPSRHRQSHSRPAAHTTQSAH